MSPNSLKFARVIEACQVVRARRRNRDRHRHIAEGLDREHQQDHAGNEQHREVGQAAESDGQEEADQQDVLEAEECRRQVSGLRMVRQREPDDQRTQVGLQAHGIEAAGTDADGEHQAEQQEELLVSGLRQQPGIQGSGEDHGRHDRNGPPRRCAPDGDEEHDREDVLHHEDGDGQVACERRPFTELFECFYGEDGAGEGQREADDRDFPDAQVVDEGRAERAEAGEQQAERDGRREQVHRGSHPHDRPGERGQLELQADAEQQQQHAEVGDRVDRRVGLETEGVKREPGGEIADERRQADLLDGEPERERNGEGDGDLGHRSCSTGS